MRRAVVRAFRTARQGPSILRSTRGSILQSSSYVLGIRTASSSNRPEQALSKTPSSMYIRRFSAALVSGLVGYGAWYTYQGNGTDVINGSNPTTAAQQSRGLTNSPTYLHAAKPQPEEHNPELDRKAVVVGPDSLYTGTITGEGPISKETDESGRKVLEMLTPEQATQKLRRNEESYLVGRGKGVVRYDVVQIPSNDPIEDDHSEKIIELPPSLAAATAARNASSDWMFWGVFDGHS